MVNNMGSTTCQNGRKHRVHKQKQDAQTGAEDIPFVINGTNPERVKESIYLGRVLRNDDRDLR